MHTIEHQNSLPLQPTETAQSREVEYNGSERSIDQEAVRTVGGRALHAVTIDHAGVSQSTYELFEQNGYVARAPHFKDILNDASRTSPVTYIGSMYKTQGAYTEKLSNEQVTKPETVVLNELSDFLQLVSGESPVQRDRDVAAKMLDTMTFIGEPEYAQAAQGIAEYWKQSLASNPDSSIVILTGIETKTIIKSDTYMLDRILANFTDEEMQQIRGRFSINPKEITSDPEQTKVVILDDWVIDGVQLGMMYQGHLNQYPDYEDSMEVQLLVATQDRLDEGLINQGLGYMSVSEAPIKAYYKTDFDDEDQAITGAHSSSDHNFDETIAFMSAHIGQAMPAGTNVVRPYRMPNARLDNIERFNRIQTTVSAS